jgi:steroid delta-isomerase-like uncharacterized protein
MEADAVKSWIQTWLTAWNSHDAYAVAALCAPDIEWTDPALPDPLRGRDAARKFVESTCQTFPDFNIAEVQPACLTSGGQALVSYRMRGTMLGDWAELGFGATGGRIDVRGIDTYEFSGGELWRCTTLYDALGAARQLKILPPVGTAADRWLARAQRIRARVQRRFANRAG